MSRYCYWPMKEIQKSDMVASMKFCPGNWSCGNITVTMKNNNTFYWSEKVFIWPSTKTFTSSLWQNFNIRGFKRAWVFVKIGQLDATTQDIHWMRTFFKTFFINTVTCWQNIMIYFNPTIFLWTPLSNNYEIIMQVPWLNRKMCSINKMS